MKKEMFQKKRGIWADSHPVLHAIVTMIFYMALVEIFSLAVIMVFEVIAALVYVLHGNGTVSPSYISDMAVLTSIANITSHILFVLIYWLRRRRQLHRFFRICNTGRGILLGCSVLMTVSITFASYFVEKTPFGNVGTALFMGIEPGIAEEVLFRIIPISAAMKSRKREQLVLPVFLFTGLGFGLIHSVNLFAGADLISTLVQVLYATGVGFLFAAIYMRTGNMWITIFLHTLNDAIDFLSLNLQTSGGVLTDTPDTSGLIGLLLFAALYYVNAFYIFRSCRRKTISNTWADIWGGQTA